MGIGVRGWIAATADRVRASDPGLARLHTALAASVSMGTSLAVEYGLAQALHAPPAGRLVGMFIGAVVAMMGGNALTGTGVWRKVRVGVFFPVAIGVGLGVGAAVGRHHVLMLSVFVLMMFAAVFVRRYGLPFFFYGFMAWMGFFFASFLKLTLGMVPGLLVSVVAATVWVLLLAVTILRQNPRRVLRSTYRAYRARARAVARACADLLEVPADDTARQSRRRRRLGARLAGLAEASLMVEAWADEPGALVPPWTGQAVRRRLLEVQHTIDRIAVGSAGLACRDATLAAAARAVVDHLARGEALAATAAAERLDLLATRAEQHDTDGWWQARHLAAAAQEFLTLAAGDREPPRIEPSEEEFEPATALMLGNLPGSPAVARDVPARGAAWNPLARLDMTTRQAVQASVAGALAIVLGEWVSPGRYYWAVIAAFVVFTGTGSRTETFLKGANRVIGTLLGLVAAIWLAGVTNGHTGWILAVILGSMFLGFYLIRVSYAYMIFFVTIMLGQLYTVLGTFSDALLVLRLEETLVGALAGVVVGLVVTPLSTRDTVRAARDSLLTGLADLLTTAADWAEGRRHGVDLDALSRVVDDRARQVALVARPMTHLLVWGHESPRVRHRVGLYVATTAHARALVLGLQRTTGSDPGAVAASCRALADAVTRLEGAAPGRPAPSVDEPLRQAEEAAFVLDRDGDGTALRSALLHLHDTLLELAATVPPLPEAPAAKAGARA